MLPKLCEYRQGAYAEMAGAIDWPTIWLVGVARLRP